MDLRSLRHVVVLARLLSYTKAAEELGMSQPALTRSIQLVEQRAKVRLFDRDRGGVHLTAVGRLFVDRAATVLREMDDLDRVLGRAASGAEGEIAYGMAPLPAAALLPSVLSDVLTSTPQMRSQVVVRNAEALLALLVAEKIEFLVCAEGQIPDSAPVKSAPLGWFETTLLVRVGHPLLASKARATGGTYPLVVAAPLGGEHGEALKSARFLEQEPHLVLEDYGALARITESSDAVWLSSSMVAAREIRAGWLQEVPPAIWNDRRRFRMMMYSLDRRSPSPAAANLKGQFQGQIQGLARSSLE
jgi:DNA-binding transcriptional LysR family regulator